MSVEPRTWIVGLNDAEGLVTHCLLSLEARFALPETVTVCIGDRCRAQSANAAGRVLGIVADPPGAAPDFLGLLRGAEARAAVEERAPVAATVAIGVARGRLNAVDDAVNLAVTTLIDWGHDVTTRTLAQ